VDPAALCPGAREIWLEIGFGGGEHLVAQAEANPDVGLIGAEPFVNGVAKALTQIEERGLTNVRVHHGDARALIAASPAGAYARAFILHPDPWPKRRHHKRRLISPAFLDELARVIAPGGDLRLCSDVPDYVRWTLAHMAGRTDFRWMAERPADWRERPADWPQTRYGRKAEAAGRGTAYLRFLRTNAAPTA